MNRVLDAKAGVSEVAFSRDGRWLAGLGRGISVWSVERAALDRTLEAPPGRRLRLLPGLPGCYAALSPEGRIQILNWEIGQGVREIAAPGPVSFVDSPDGKLIAATGPASPDSSGIIALVWDAEGRERFRAPAGLGGAAALAISPDGRQLVVAAYDTDFRVWNTRDGEILAHIAGMTVAMFDLVFSPDGKQLAAAGVDRTVYLWDTRTWKLIRKLTGQPEMIGSLAFSPDGRLLVAGGRNEFLAASPASVLLWDVASGKLLLTLSSKTRVAGVAFSPAGTLVAVADLSPRVNLLDVPRA